MLLALIVQMMYHRPIILSIVWGKIMKYNILIIEDNPLVCEAISAALSREGYNVIINQTGANVIEDINKNMIHLVLLDLMLPTRTGEDVLKEIRQGKNIPVIIISSKDSDVEKAVHLGLGADDYVTKPVSNIELIARIKAVLRRMKVTSDLEQETFIIQDLIINFKTREVHRDHASIALTNKEFEIFKLLIEHANAILSKDQIYRAVWHDDYFSDENIINVHIRRLREKIEHNPSKPTLVLTVRGVGYRLGSRA
ncbi:MAG: DNA-binding response regulator [Acholeplasmatales bacterium]|nr:MAG: DNA-binding response regulator [Acholeplasmatales bacterium]